MVVDRGPFESLSDAQVLRYLDDFCRHMRPEGVEVRRCLAGVMDRALVKRYVPGLVLDALEKMWIEAERT